MFTLWRLLRSDPSPGKLPYRWNCFYWERSQQHKIVCSLFLWALWFGQNARWQLRGSEKNLAFMWYYLWLVMNGLHSAINYEFLLPGHAKFSPDWCFGLVKQKTRRTLISSLFDIARAVEESSSVNASEIVGLHNGTVRVATYDWVTYLASDKVVLSLSLW